MRTLFVIGSPKGGKSVSRLLADELANRLGGETAFVHPLRANADDLLAEVERADLVVLSFPLYVDSLPAPLTRVLELLAASDACRGKPLAALVQCGFPEAVQCDTAVAICRTFARQAGMRWAGALQMGMGPMLADGIEKVPGGGAPLRDALDAAAVALAHGEAITAEAEDLFAKPLMPQWLYLAGGNLGWRWQMRQHRARTPIAFRPYA